MTRYEFDWEWIEGRGWRRLYLIRGGKIVRFNKADIPGFAVIAAKLYYDWGEKYILLLAPGTRRMLIVPPVRGEWGDWYESWDEVSRDLGVDISEAKRFAWEEYPNLAGRLDAVEEFKREYGE